MSARHGVALARAHEERVFPGLQVFLRQRDFVHPDPDVLGAEWNFLLLLHAGLAARNAAEGTDLELPMIAFLVELDQHVVR